MTWRGERCWCSSRSEGNLTRREPPSSRRHPDSPRGRPTGALAAFSAPPLEPNPPPEPLRPALRAPEPTHDAPRAQSAPRTHDAPIAPRNLRRISNKDRRSRSRPTHTLDLRNQIKKNQGSGTRRGCGRCGEARQPRRHALAHGALCASPRGCGVLRATSSTTGMPPRSTCGHSTSPDTVHQPRPRGPTSRNPPTQPRAPRRASRPPPNFKKHRSKK